MNERHLGYVNDCAYRWINLLNDLKKRNPIRFYEFYRDQTIYDYLDQLQETYE